VSFDKISGPPRARGLEEGATNGDRPDGDGDERKNDSLSLSSLSLFVLSLEMGIATTLMARLILH
jgi:hypothetical protein